MLAWNLRVNCQKRGRILPIRTLQHELLVAWWPSTMQNHCFLPRMTDRLVASSTLGHLSKMGLHSLMYVQGHASYRNLHAGIQIYVVRRYLIRFNYSNLLPILLSTESQPPRRPSMTNFFIKVMADQWSDHLHQLFNPVIGDVFDGKHVHAEERNRESSLLGGNFISIGWVNLSV